MANISKLLQISEDIWQTESKLNWYFLTFGIRMVVVRLQCGGLWLHSPVEIDDNLLNEINSLGKVEHIVAPNCFHHVHAGDAKKKFPDAKLWAAPGLESKRKDLDFDAVINEEDTGWGDTIEYEYVGGMPRINEVVFLHKTSRSLICSDFVFNIKHEDSLIMKLLWKLSGTYKKFGQSREWRWMISNVFDNVDSVNRVLKWEFDRIIMAHGEIIECTNAQLFDVIKNKGKNTLRFPGGKNRGSSGGGGAGRGGGVQKTKEPPPSHPPWPNLVRQLHQLYADFICRKVPRQSAALGIPDSDSTSSNLLQTNCCCVFSQVVCLCACID